MRHVARRRTNSNRSVEERLRTFCRVVQDAVSRRAIQQGTIASGFQLKADRGQPVQVTTNLGDEEDLRSLMLDVRKFFLNQEAAHFLTVTNLVERRLTDQELKDFNRTNRDSWRSAMNGGIGYQMNGVAYDAEKMFNLMVNGGLFHYDVWRCVQIGHAERNLIVAALDGGLIDLN